MTPTELKETKAPGSGERELGLIQNWLGMGTGGNKSFSIKSW